MTNRKNRRQILCELGQLGFLGSLSLAGGCAKTRALQEKASPANGSFSLTGNQNKKFLFVFTAMGGASINDSFLAVRHSETDSYKTVNAFPDRLVYQAEGSNLRAVNWQADSVGPLPFEVDTNQARFLSKHHNDIMVVPINGTTVAHPVGQKRSVTGHDAWNGRTLQEALAAQYGEGMLFPNVNMSTVGYAEDGTDSRLPAFARALQVANPSFFPFSLHGHKGIRGAPDEKLIAIARNARNKAFEPNTDFFRSAFQNKQVNRWLELRNRIATVERMALINSLNPFENSDDLPFEDFDLKPNSQAEKLRDILPNIGVDPLQSQAMLAYMMVTQGLTCSVTFGLDMNVSIDGRDEDNRLLNNCPTGFDYSHNAHRATQALLWQRSLDTIDRLITLLKATPIGGGQSYWDHSMIYIATEFGRDKKRPDEGQDYPSGHHTNNAVTVISPMANGGQALGGIDKNTLLTYGFDPDSGRPEPGRLMTDREVYAGLAHTLGIDTSGSGLPDMKAMRRKP